MKIKTRIAIGTIIEGDGIEGEIRGIQCEDF
jgi:hypothetical protein